MNVGGWVSGTRWYRRAAMRPARDPVELLTRRLRLGSAAWRARLKGVPRTRLATRGIPMMVRGSHRLLPQERRPAQRRGGDRHEYQGEYEGWAWHGSVSGLRYEHANEGQTARGCNVARAAPPPPGNMAGRPRTVAGAVGSGRGFRKPGSGSSALEGPVSLDFPTCPAHFTTV